MKSLLSALRNRSASPSPGSQPESRLRDLVMNAPDLILEIDPAGQIVFANRYTDIYLGRSVFEFLPPEQVETARHRLRQALEGGQVEQFELQTFNHHGQLIWNELRVRPLFEAGKISGFSLWITNITHRKLLEQQAEQASRQLAMLNEIGRVVSEETDLDRVLEVIRQQLAKVVDFDFYSVRIFNTEQGTITYLAVYEGGQYWKEPDAPLIPGTHAYQVFESGRSYLRLLTPEEIEEERQHPELRVGDRSSVTASLIFAPLKRKGRTIGALSVQRYQPSAYTQEDLKLVEDVAIQVTIAIENARLLASLQQELSERRKAEAQIRQLNEELEQRVRQRTAQLEMSNKELESFSYSVSHDLRAPLRAINGYSQALLEDYSSRLDETARDYLQKIRTATRNMERLIDDLLNLARITRSQMTFQELDLSRLFDEIMAELRAAEPERQAIIRLQPGLTALGDEQLLRIMMTNLCSNAWKFTRKKAVAEIEFGLQAQESGPAAFFIRDNGAGFHMAYADKLFNSFQRLHAPDEFEGTGIGLAIVKRIVQRHGGRIWAEGKPDKGATFYFTIAAPGPAG